MPIDANCRVEVVFPFDMPLSADAFTSISVSGFINGQDFIPEINPFQNLIAFNGCQRPVDASNSTLIIKINKIRNLPYIGNSAPFIIRIYSSEITEYFQYDPTTDSYYPDV